MKQSEQPTIKDVEKKAQQIAKSLNKSVAAALEKKRRLGQYAVVWDGEKVVRILPDDIPKANDKTDIPAAEKPNRSDPKNANVFYNRGLAYSAKGESFLTEPFKILTKPFTLNPEFAEAYFLQSWFGL